MSETVLIQERSLEAIAQQLSLMEIAIHLETAKKLHPANPKNPAPKKDRVKGSKTNKEGSASADGKGIKLNPAIEKSLGDKAKSHNKEHGADSSKRAFLSTLKKVWRRGAGAYSVSHRRTVQSRQQWAMGRVNAFLYLLANGKPKNPNYITDYDLLPVGHPKATRKR
ncbi:MAG: hypothetical protein RBJ76_03285 [Stenomitos frigidus ULC029]